MRRAWIDLVALAAFALAALVFYWPALLGGLVLLPLDNLWTMPPWFGPPNAVPHNLLIGDMLLENYPWKLILEQAVRQHELPLWNPYEMDGLPYLATAQTGVLYPFTVLFLLLGPLRAYGWYCALHQFLAASFGYALLRRLGGGRLAALVAGLTFAFCFFLTVSYIWPMVLGAAVWLPLMLWSLAGLAAAVEKGTIGRAVALDLPVGVLAVAFSVLGGHPEITFYALFVTAFYGLYRGGMLLVRRGHRPGLQFLGLAGGVIGIGLLIGSIQLAPFLEVLRSNNRQGETTYQQVISYAFPKIQVLGFLMPDFFGNPATHEYFDLTRFQWVPVERNALGQPTDPPHTIFWGTKNYVEAGAYIGVVPLLLATIGALRSQHRDRWFFSGFVVLAALLAFGTPLYALVYYGLPFFSQLRTPFRWVYPLDFSAAVLAGLGADWLWQRGLDRYSSLAPGRWASRRLLWWGPSLLGIAGLILLALSLIARDRSIALADRLLAHQPALARAFASGTMLYSYEFRNLAIFFALLALGGIPIAVLGQGRSNPAAATRPRRAWDSIRTVCAVLIVGLSVGDLFFFGMPFASKQPAALLDQHVDLAAVIRTALTGPRVASLGDPWVLRANLGVLLGIPTIAGYDTIIPSRFVRLWSLVEPPVDLPFNQIGRLHRVESLGSPILDLLSVRYVLSTASIESPAVRQIGKVGTINIYERPTALPRAFIVGQALWVPDADAAFRAMASPAFHPDRLVILEGPPGPAGGGRGSAAIVASTLNRVEITADVEGAGWLVLTDANAPGWLATVDGQPATVWTADGDLRAVYLTDGRHRVVFRYAPLSFRVGAYLTGLGLIVLALVASWPAWRRLIGHYTGQAERVLRNAALPMVTSFLNKGIDFGFAALMLRILGPGDVGEYTVAIILMGYFEILTNFGLNALIVREVARDRSIAGRYLANALSVRLGLCALSAPIVAGLALVGRAWLGLGTHGITAFVLLCLALIPGNISATLTALFNAWERIEIPAGVSVAINLARVTLGTAALLVGAGIIGLAAIALVLNIALVVIFTLIVRRALQVHLESPARGDLAAMLSESFPLLINHVLVTVFFKIDILLLQVFKGSESVGYYATAYKWLDGFLIIPSTFTFAVYPVLARFAQEADSGLRAAYEVSARILLATGIPLAIAVAALAGDLILLLGGQAYYPESARALAILICFLPFSYLNGLTQYALIAVGRQRFITIAFIISAGFNILANVLLIPRFGFYGASVVTVASEIVLMVPFLHATRQSIGSLPWYRTAGKPALAGLVMAGVTWLGRSFEPHLAVLLGAAAYIAVAWGVQLFSPDEVKTFRRIIAAVRGQATFVQPGEAHG